MRRIFIILLVVVLVWAGVWFFYVRPREKTSTPIPKVVTSFFPTATTVNNINVLGTPSNNIGGANGSTTSNSPLRQITAHPVAGYTIFSLTNQVAVPSTTAAPATTTAGATSPSPKKPAVSVTAPTVTVQTVTDHYIRYVSRINGYVYEIKNDTPALQITNLFIPNIYEAFFADGNNTAILRFLRADDKTIATYSVPIPPLNSDGTRTQEQGTYLSDNIKDMAVSPDETQIVSVIDTPSGAMVDTSSSTGTHMKTIARSSFLEWLPQWTTNTVYLQTKAASVANGFLYSIVQSSGRLQRVVGDIPGLTASVSPSGTYVLYSESTANGFTTELFNTKTNITSAINLNILPEKCAWLQNENLICAGNTSVPEGTYPDDWYSGIVHFADQLYEINTVSNTYTVLYDGSTAAFDMTNIQVDEGQRLIYFIDKTTGLLWQYSY